MGARWRANNSLAIRTSIPVSGLEPNKVLHRKKSGAENRRVRYPALTAYAAGFIIGESPNQCLNVTNGGA